MKVLHVVHQFFPHHRHGVEHSTLDLAKAQRKRGWEVAILAGEKGLMQHEITLRRSKFDGFPVYRFYFNPRRQNGFLKHPGFAKRFGTLLDEQKPDLIHVQHLQNLSLEVLKEAQDRGIPLVFTLRDYTLLLEAGDLTVAGARRFEEGAPGGFAPVAAGSVGEKLATFWDVFRQNAFQRRSWALAADLLKRKFYHVQAPLHFENMDRWFHARDEILTVLGKSDAVVAISDDLARRFTEKSDGRVHVQGIQQVPDLSVFEKGIRKPGKKVRIGYVGKFAWIKGVHVLMQALRELPEDRYEAVFVGAPSWTNVGEVGYWRAVRRMGAGLPVSFQSGGFRNVDAPGIYDSFDIIVVPSICHEAYGRVVAEALAAGVPVVCSDEGGPSELVRDGVNGRHFAIGDVTALADVLKELVDSPDQIVELSKGTGLPKDAGRYEEELHVLYQQVIGRDE